MAIKVNGTTVINDSRVISNISGLKTVGGTSLLGSGDISAGAVDDIYFENAESISSNKTVSTTRSTMTIGPVTIGNSATITVPDGGFWSIV